MVTVDKALTRGQLTVNIPVFFIMFGVMGLCFYLAILKLIPFYFAPTSILLGPVVAWIYWSFAITRWRIWAFSNVNDVHELKTLAISGQLIWPDGSFFERTEIRTNKERILINELEKRFKEPKKKKQFIDDPSIPPVTKIFYSKLNLIYELVLMTACLSFGVYLLVTKDSWIFGTGLILVGAYFAIKDFKKLSTFEPQIILDNKGIEITGDNYPWTEIQEFTATLETFGKNSNSYLILETSSGTVKINIDDYDTTFRQLRHILSIYKGRFDKATTANNVFASSGVDA
jgi:hypothetical protein